MFGLVQATKNAFKESEIEVLINNNKDKVSQSALNYVSNLSILRFIFFPFAAIFYLTSICIGLLFGILLFLGKVSDGLFKAFYDFTWVHPLTLGLKDEDVEVLTKLVNERIEKLSAENKLNGK